jgi:hypothetical protein
MCEEDGNSPAIKPVIDLDSNNRQRFFSNLRSLMTVLIMPLNVRESMGVVAEAAKSLPVHQLVRTAVFYVIGKLSDVDLKARARQAQVPIPSFTEAINCIAWVLCEAVRCKSTVDQFREFIAEQAFLNTPEVLEVFENSYGLMKKCLVDVAPDADHYVRLDWRCQVEFARRGLRSFKRPHVVMSLRTRTGDYTLEASPSTIVDLHETLDAALQTCRTGPFRRIQRFVK